MGLACHGAHHSQHLSSTLGRLACRNTRSNTRRREGVQEMERLHGYKAHQRELPSSLGLVERRESAVAQSLLFPSLWRRADPRGGAVISVLRVVCRTPLTCPWEGPSSSRVLSNFVRSTLTLLNFPLCVNLFCDTGDTFSRLSFRNRPLFRSP